RIAAHVVEGVADVGGVERIADAVEGVRLAGGEGVARLLAAHAVEPSADRAGILRAARAVDGVDGAGTHAVVVGVAAERCGRAAGRIAYRRNVGLAPRPADAGATWAYARRSTHAGTAHAAASGRGGGA